MTYISNKFKKIHILRDETIQKGKIKKTRFQVVILHSLRFYLYWCCLRNFKTIISRFHTQLISILSSIISWCNFISILITMWYCKFWCISYKTEKYCVCHWSTTNIDICSSKLFLFRNSSSKVVRWYSFDN